MEPAIRWAGNPNIVLGLKLLSLQITVQVRGILLNKEMFVCSRVFCFFQNFDCATFSWWIYKYLLHHG